MKTQLSKPARGRASYTEEYKQEALGLEIRFVRLGPQVLSRFVQSLGRRVFWGLNAKFHRILSPAASTGVVRSPLQNLSRGVV